MADKKVSALPLAESLVGDELLYLVQDGSDKSVTPALLRQSAQQIATAIDADAVAEATLVSALGIDEKSTRGFAAAMSIVFGG